MSYTTLPLMIEHMVNAYHNAHALNYRVDGSWESMSTELFLEQVRRLSLGLHGLGVRKGESVGILAQSSPQWLIIDLAIMIAGGVSVPMFAHISEENFCFEVENAEMQTLFLVGQEAWKKAEPHRCRFKRLITLDIERDDDDQRLSDFEQLLKDGDQRSREDPTLYARLRDDVVEDDLATIIYTSGSTGVPKGVELTHRNLISLVSTAHQRFPKNPRKDRILSLLPLAHVFERMIMYYYLTTGVSVYFVDDIKKTVALCSEIKPTCANMVPLLIDRIYAMIKIKIEEEHFLKKIVARWAFCRAHTKLQGIGHFFADFFVYRKMRRALGGHFRSIVVGGAPLDSEICHFFLKIGIPLYQGYGLTESSSVLCCNYSDYNKIGMVGLPWSGVEVTLSDEGEIIARGPNIMRGYHRDPERTAKTLDNEGWLHTGDRGEVDEDGFFRVTGRFKEIMKTSAGKMVVPMPIEQAICRSPLIDMAMVVAEGKKFASCLLFPNEEKKPTELEAEKLISAVNEYLNEWEKIRAFRLVWEPLTVEGGELTPTLKIRRSAVQKKYRGLIQSMYQKSR